MFKFLENLSFIPLTASIDIHKVIRRGDGYILQGVVKEGIVNVGDSFKYKDKIITVDNIFINMQQSPMALETEVIEIYTKQDPGTIKGPATVINEDAVTVLTLGSVTILRENNVITPDEYYEYLHSEELIDKVRVKVPKLISEADEKVQNVMNKGLKGIISRGKLAKGIGLTAALGLFGYSLYKKLSRPCALKTGVERLKCQQQVAERIIAELTKQQAACNSLTDPLRRRHCLQAVESKKKAWIKKSAEIAEKIAKMEK